MKTEPTDYSLTPPELTDSEGEEDSEDETEDDMLIEYRPSRNIASGISRSTKSDGYHLSERLLTSKTTIKNKSTSNTDADSSDEDTEKPQINKEINKNRLHKKRLTYPCHPPGRYSPMIEDQQHTETSKEIGSITVKEEEVSNTDLNSSITWRKDQGVNWPSGTSINKRHFQPSGTDPARIDQAIVKLENDRDVQRKNLIRKTDRIHEKNSSRKDIIINHEVILPELIESDEEHEADHESGNPYDEDPKRRSQTMIHETHLSLEKEDINNFQPTGRNRPCTEKTEADIRKNGYDHYRNNASKIRIDRDHEEEIEEADTADLHVKITTERHRKTLPKNTDLKDEDKHDKGKEQRDTSIAPREVIRPPGKESSCKRKMEKRETIIRDDDRSVIFSPARSPRHAIEGDLLRFLYKNPSNNSTSWV